VRALASAKTQQERIQREAYEALERLGGKLFKEEDYLQEGNKLIIPEHTTLREISRLTAALADDQEAINNFSHVFNYKPWDVALNAYVALREHFGATRVTGTQGFFGMQPPQMIDVPISSTETVQVPWGEFQTPNLPRVKFTFGSTEHPEYGLVGVIYATGPKEAAAAIHGVWDLVEKQLKKTSIYKGKAFTAEEMPRFVDVDIDPAKVVFSEQTGAELDASIWSAIRDRGVLESLGQKVKRAVLLEGEFGTGKSLAIGLTAQEASRYGWTTIIVRPGRDSITDAFRMARMYGPAVICVEDVDTIASASEEAAQISHILELFDGVESKHQKVMVVLTTNHPQLLQKGLVRAGRLDAVIRVGTPDAAGIRKLIEVNLPSSLLSGEIEWEPITTALAGYLPAFIVEAATRALRFAVARTPGWERPEAADALLTPAQEAQNQALMDGLRLTTSDLVQSAESLKAHLELMNGAKTGEVRPSVDSAIGRVVEKTLTERVRPDLLLALEEA